MAIAERIYQASDLAGSERRSFIADAVRSQARLRSTDGESLVMLRAARLENVAAIRDHAVAYLMLDLAMRRPRAERRTTDYGSWAFLDVFDDEDIEEFQQEIGDEIARAASGRDRTAIDDLLHQWQMSADTLSDPVAREILDGSSVDDTDWVEVKAPAPVDPETAGQA